MHGNNKKQRLAARSSQLIARSLQLAARSSHLTAIGSLLAAVIFFSRCMHGQNRGTTDPRGDEYASAATCAGCHSSIANSYAHNVHYRTSARVDSSITKQLVAGSRGQFYFLDSSYIRIEEDDHALFQSHYLHGEKSVSPRLDIAFGSGEKAQTFGYWKGNSLQQLPLTWYAAAHSWANSPGFTARRAYYDRVIVSRCFECHGSFVRKELVKDGPLSVTEHLDSSSIIYGIDCQRCHGPAAKHVEFHQKHPGEKMAKYIISIKTLPRQRQLDLCGVCHSGNDLSPQRSLFGFTPGDTLSHFYFPGFGENTGVPDVHGQQMQLLASSRCFIKSSMTCGSCHNAHVPENQAAYFVSKCMDCHQASAHAAEMRKEGEQKKRDFNLTSATCIDCHMPLQASKVIHFNNGAGAKDIPYFIRTHRIAIYK